MIVVAKIMLVVLFFRPEIECVKFINTRVNESHELILKHLFLVMGKSYSVCFWDDKKYNDLLDIIFNHCFEKDISIVFETQSSSYFQSCEVFVFLDILTSKICSLFLESRLVYLTFDYKVIITNFSLSGNFVQLEYCASSFDLASVTIITQQAEILVLDSPFVTPRRFRPISNNNPAGSSFNKLHGILINVATFHFPPFTEIKSNGSLGNVLISFQNLSLFITILVEV